MNPDQIFHASRGRCMADPGFVPAFYERLFEVAPEMAHFFANVDMSRQEAMLKSALYEMADIEHLSPDQLEYWFTLSHRHSELQIDGTHYDIWTGCLLRIVSEHDPLFTDDVENAWCAKLEQIVALMKLIY